MKTYENGNDVKYLCRELVCRCEEFEKLKGASANNSKMEELRDEITWLYSEISVREKRAAARHCRI